MTTKSGRPDANDAVFETIQRAVDAGEEIGVQVAAYLDGELVVDTWAGLANPDDGQRVNGETLFNIFSVSKAIVATAVHIQAERGLLEYDAPIARYWPEFGGNGKAEISVRHVLTHRAGIPQMPLGMTVERICDWNWMTSSISELSPLTPPGTHTHYLAMTFGWVLGETVRRTDPLHRSFGRFVKEEISDPLGIADLWFGVPDQAVPRVAKLFNASPPHASPPDLFLAAIPPQVALVPEVFGDRRVQQAELPAVGGICNARSCARFWGMLAQGGTLGGVRLLSAERVRAFKEPRPHPAEPDPVMFGMPLPLSAYGYWLGIDRPPVCAVANDTAICSPGAGNSIGWADMDRKLAVSICHNRMSPSKKRPEDVMARIADSVRSILAVV